MTIKDDTERPGRTGSRRPTHPGLAFGRELLIVVVGALVVSTLIRAFLGQNFVIPSESMENTLLKGDRVLVQKVTDFHRGDVVVFRDPGGWLHDGEVTSDPTIIDKVLEFVGFPTKSTPGHLIKRVIGMPGDKVVCCDDRGRLTVNGYPLDETAYLYADASGPVNPSEVRFTVVVPKDRIFVMGDHRDLSADSRCHLSDLSISQGKGQVAFVPVKLVVGSAIAIVYPFDRASRMRRPATFAGVPPPTEPAPAVGSISPAGVGC